MKQEMMRLTVVVAFLSVFLVFGSAQAASQEDPDDQEDKVSAQTKVDEVASGVEIEYDNFKLETKYTGPEILIRPSSVNPYYWHSILLRGYKKKGSSQFQIYVDTHYHATRYTQFRNAFDGKGVKLPLTILDHEVISCEPDGECLFNEVFSLDISKAYIQSHGKLRETEFKIEGVSNYLTFRISGEYFSGFLKGLNKKKPAVDTSSDN